MACRSCKKHLQDLARRPMFVNFCSKDHSELTGFIFQGKVPESQISWHWQKSTRHCRQWDSQGPYSLTAPEANWEPDQERAGFRGGGSTWWTWGQSLPTQPGSCSSSPVTISWAERWRLSWFSRFFHEPVLSRLLLVKILISIRVSASLLIMPLIWVTLSSIKH